MNLNFAGAVRQINEMSLLIGESEGDKLVCADLDETAHLFVSGVTGTGKSVFVESMLLSLILRNKPERLKLILFDSKMVELSRYSGVSHMLIPTVTDPWKFSPVIEWVEYETMKRLQTFASAGIRSIEQYNELVEVTTRKIQCIPRILVVIDDLTTVIADHPKIADNIIKILMKGRAVGIHLLLVTQSTSLKAVRNIVEIVPSKAVFLTATEKESRFLLRNNSACQLEPFGSAIFAPTIGRSCKIRTIMATNNEADMILDAGKRNFTKYSEDVIASIERSVLNKYSREDRSGFLCDMEKIYEAADVLFQTQSVSVSIIQRRLNLGYSTAARIVDRLENLGVISPFEESKPRRILISKEQWEKLKERLKYGEKE